MKASARGGKRSAVVVGVVMGSDSDWAVMQHAVAVLAQFGVAHEAKVVSAHRTPDAMFAYAARARARGLACIIAGAGGAAHLPGMIAAKTTLPVLGVPVPSRHLQGQDSLLSIVQMPRGIPVATFAIGEAGAVNAALFAVSMLARSDPALARRLAQYRAALARKVAAMTLPVNPPGSEGSTGAGATPAAARRATRARTAGRAPARAPRR
jgi:5-(carboxyamino)imidazole ribonucleotide mutase